MCNISSNTPLNCQSLIDYYIVDRKNGKTYSPDVCMDKYLVAYSNCATDQHRFIINFSRIKKGLAERRYRLIPKSF